MRKKRAVASGVGRFTKRPVTVEAVRYREDITIIEALDVCDWIIGGGYPWITHADADAGEADKGIRLDPADGGLIIRTLEGDMKVSPGDWIIRGAAGEFYPCKPDIFEATYAPAAGADAPAAGGVDIAAVRARLRAASPRPWARDTSRTRVWSPKEECGVCGAVPEDEDRYECVAEGVDDEGDEWHDHVCLDCHVLLDADGGTITGNYDYEEGGVVNWADSELILHAPEDLERLCDEVERLRAELGAGMAS